MNKVSIIVPVYNSEDYIIRCVYSIVNQSYKNIELLLINDGSSDNSFDIINNLSKKYSNIRCFNQENHGVSYTRNFGIKKATGRYVMFVDNDDYLDKDYVSTFVKAIEDCNYDYVIGGYKRVDDKGNILLKKIFKDTEWSYFMFVTPWGKIFDRFFLLKNKIEYLDVKIGEDIYFNTLAISYSKKKKIIDYAGYNWFYNTHSISNTVHRENNSSNIDDLLLLFNKIIRNIDDDYFKMNKMYIKYFFLKTVIWYTLYSCKGNNHNDIYNNYVVLRNFITNEISKCYKGIFFFNPKGENLSTKLIIIIFVILDKLKLLKFFIYIYSKM